MKNVSLGMISTLLLCLLLGYSLSLMISQNGTYVIFPHYNKSSNHETIIQTLEEPLPHFLKTSVQKSQYEYVLTKLDEFQLPRELALIPVIESQYNPFATSPRGAAGLWQLMPNTAKSYGLVNDERFELEASTNAALLHLKQLYNQFGDWEYAVAAYNAGSKRVQQALDKNPSAKGIQDLSLPEETKQYVSTYYLMQTYLIKIPN